VKKKFDRKFFVYIIESPSSKDIYIGRSEGDLIKKAVSLNRIPCASKVVVSREPLINALKIGIYEEMLKHKNLLPVIHLSAHGSESGIQLTDSSILLWKELRDYFKPINKAFNGNLLLCMSSCQGSNSCKMSMQENDDEYPFWAVVGNSTEPLWSETAIAYATFYHHVALGNSLEEAIKTMKIASGNNDFTLIRSKVARDAYLKVLARQDTEKIQSKLEANIEKENPEKLQEIKSKNN